MIRRILHVVGARPNFMKAAPVHAALKARGGFAQSLVHTGQHYDPAMSDTLFRQLGLPAPDHNLGVGSGTHAVQTAEIMVRLEPILAADPPDLVLLYGDVNSTMAGALVAAKLGVPAAHVEAGLRSFDRTMPEEVNRLVTDRLCELLLTPSEDGDENLLREGVEPAKIRRVGNVMIDTLARLLPAAVAPPLPGLAAPYVLVTLHRPANVDDPAALAAILKTLMRAAQKTHVVFPVHPRTRARIDAAPSMAPSGSRLILTAPLGYLEFLGLQKGAAAVVTDSGGIQEETTYLGIPCLTVRPNTERPVTVESGTNTLVGSDMTRLEAELDAALSGRGKKGRPIPLWDGRAAERIADELAAWSGWRRPPRPA